MVEALSALPLETLRRRSSTKWRTYPDDVLPLFVAETDFALAEPIQARLAEALAIGDTGYTPPEPGLREAFAGFARRRWGWDVDPARVRSTGDVIMGVVEILRAVISPGDRVVICPPVYPPFWMAVREAGGEPCEVPLIDEGTGWTLDLDGIEQALAGGARAVLLCNPHNPTGTVHSRSALVRLAELAEAHGSAVVSDEIHGPLAYDPAAFTSFLTASPAAARVGYAVTSASKTYNLAGLKCAVMVTADEATTAVVRGMSPEVEWRTGLLGALSNVAAFDAASDPWLESLLVRLDENRRLLAELLAEELPRARYLLPDAGFLAWIDVSGYDWGDDPAPMLRREARVALNPGPEFGRPGRGHVRINFACGPDVLTEAVRRIGRVAAAG